MSASKSAITALESACVFAGWTLATGCGVWPPPPPEPADACQAVEEILSGWGEHLRNRPSDDLPRPPPAGLPNPASVYCGVIGGELRIEQDEAGQYGICVLPDGTEREEWELYCGDCQAEPYCTPSMLE